MQTACVIGNPIDHSISPYIHQFWLHQLGIDGAYNRQLVSDDQLSGFIQDMPKNGLQGCNVTLPHKVAVMPLCHKLTIHAKRVGAVNTIWVDNGVIWGDNSDWWGFNQNILHNTHFKKITRRSAIILGAGGSARAVVYGLIKLGFSQIILLNRTMERAQDIKKIFPQIVVDSLDKFDKYANMANFLVNCTSAYMNGGALQCDFAKLPAGCLVHDISYKPLITPFLQGAINAGLPVIDGLGMLIYQAIPGFKKWFLAGELPIIKPKITQKFKNYIYKRALKQPIILGLTGSIGMGKSTIAEMARQMGLPVVDSDAMVHDIYNNPQGTGFQLIAQTFPESLEGGQINRAKLGAAVFANREKLQRLEAILHPILRQKRNDMVAQYANQPIILFDVPLLFERAIDKECDFTMVVSATAEIQRQRVLARPQMTPEKFANICKSQMPDNEKRQKADFIIDSSTNKEHAQEQLVKILKTLGVAIL